MKRIFSILTVLLFILSSTAASTGDSEIEQILVKLDQMANFHGQDFSCIYTIVSQKPGEEQEVTQARMFRRDERNQFVLLLLQPKANRGQGYLQVDDNVWFYDPESRKFSHSSLRENIEDSEAKNSDLNRSSLSEDYQVTSWQKGTLGNYPVYVIDLEAVHNEVSYVRMKIWVRSDVTLLLKEEDYSVSGRLMRTSFYPNYTRVGENFLPAKILIVDELEEGERSQITMRDPSIAQLPDSVFSKAYLERVNN